VRMGAVRVLAARGDPAAAEALSELLEGGGAEVRAAAPRAMGGHGAWPDPRPDPRPQPEPQPRPRPMP